MTTTVAVFTVTRGNAAAGSWCGRATRWRRSAGWPTHFYEHLLDGDLANNSLSWQRVAGTGTDTRPNRLLNPLRQAERFDPRGDYVRRYVPELSTVADVRQPWTLSTGARNGYPVPIVDLGEGRARFLAARG